MVPNPITFTQLTATIGAAYIAAFLAAFLGSAHCLVMCGVLCAGLGGSTWPDQCAYQLGRLSAYLSLGFVSGWAGAHLNLSFHGRIENLSHVISALALIGIATAMASKILAFGQQTSANATSVVSLGRRYLLGIGNGFLPCAWLFGFLALAATSANAIQGALILAMLWLGSVPILLMASRVVHAPLIFKLIENFKLWLAKRPQSFRHRVQFAAQFAGKAVLILATLGTLALHMRSTH